MNYVVTLTQDTIPLHRMTEIIPDEFCNFASWLRKECLSESTDEELRGSPGPALLPSFEEFTQYTAVPILTEPEPTLKAYTETQKAELILIGPQFRYRRQTHRGCRVDANGFMSPFRVSRQWREECIENGKRVVYETELLNWGMSHRRKGKSKKTSHRACAKTSTRVTPRIRATSRSRVTPRIGKVIPRAVQARKLIPFKLSK